VFDYLKAFSLEIAVLGQARRVSLFGLPFAVEHKERSTLLELFMLSLEWLAGSSENVWHRARLAEEARAGIGMSLRSSIVRRR
jgi:hypothetical protein